MVSLVRNRRGNAVVEMALMLPLLLLIVFGITEFGRAWMAVNVMHTATREGARLAAVSSGGSDSTSIRNRVTTVMEAANLTPKEITITWPAIDDLDERKLTVAVTHDFTVLSGHVLEMFDGTIELSAQTTMRKEF